jgi:hypothetical protein
MSQNTGPVIAGSSGGKQFGHKRLEAAFAHRHVSRKILDDFPQVFAQVSQQQLRQREQFRLSLESKMDDPVETMKALNRQFQLTEKEQEAVSWGWLWEPGETMFHVVNGYTRGACTAACPLTPAIDSRPWVDRYWRWSGKFKWPPNDQLY